MTALLELRGASVRFGGVVACDAITMTVAEGEIRGLIGPNGAGKTTLFNLISGLARPSDGALTYLGTDITRVPAHQRAALGIMRTFQTTQLLAGYTVLENVLIGLHSQIPGNPLRGLLRRDSPDAVAARRVAETLDYLDIAGSMFRDVGSLTFAERRYVEIARAIVAGPRLLLLDEPAAGLTPAQIEELDRLIARLRAERGMTIILVEHVISLVMNVCDRITVLDRGRIIAEGSAREIANNGEVRAAYLGQSEDAAAQ